MAQHLQRNNDQILWGVIGLGWFGGIYADWPTVMGERYGILRAELSYFANCVAAGKVLYRITPEQSRDVVGLDRCGSRVITHG